MNVVDRVKNILINPKQEWPKIAAEPATVQSLYVGYIMILAAIGPLAIIIRGLSFGSRSERGRRCRRTTARPSRSRSPLS